jgi:hypothetical protein
VGDTITTSSFYVSSVLNALPQTGGTLTGQLVVNGATGQNPLITQVNSTEVMRIDSSGNVGIGTTTPSYPLTVVSNSSAVGLATYGRSSDNLAGTYYFSNNGATTYGTILASATEFRLTSTPAAAVQTFYTNGTERMRIDSSGNLLVGTTTLVGSARLSVVNNLSSNAGINIDDSANSSGGTFARFSVSGGTLCGYISRVTTTNAVAYNTSSDYRLKENIIPMSGALAKVQQLKPVTYRWKDCGVDSQGFIAHELQAVVPDCVTGEKDAVDADGNPVYQGIDTSFLVATLTAAIQEQQALINQLQADVAALKGKP